MEDMLTSYILSNYEHPQDWEELSETRAYSYASDFIYDFITNEFDKWAKENTSEIYKKEEGGTETSEVCEVCVGNDFQASWYPESQLELSPWFNVTEDKKLIVALNDLKSNYLGFIDIDINYCPECGRKLEEVK